MPSSVRMFRTLMFVSVAVLAAAMAYAWIKYEKYILESGGVFYLISAIMIVALIAVTLWASNGRSTVARRVLTVVIVVLAINFLYKTLTTTTRDLDALLWNAVWVLSLLIQAYAVRQLWSAEANVWYSAQGKPADG